MAKIAFFEIMRVLRVFVWYLNCAYSSFSRDFVILDVS